jgi:hypothetical protein
MTRQVYMRQDSDTPPHRYFFELVWISMKMAKKFYEVAFYEMGKKNLGTDLSPF